MKRVLLNDAAVASVNRMRDSLGSYETVKMQIANAQSDLAMMLSFGKYEESDIHPFVDEVIEVMGVLADYNSLVDELSETSDQKLASYHLECRKDDNDQTNYEYAPKEMELMKIKKFLEGKDVKLQGLKLDEMTLSEIAEAAGLTGEELCHKIRMMVTSPLNNM